MNDPGWTTARLEDVPSLRMQSHPRADWRPVRHHLGVRAFGVSAYVARAEGDPLVPEHDELAGGDPDQQEHEELYFVGSGRATFTLDGRVVDAPAGTLVFVREPRVVRSAVAGEAGTTVLAVGAQRGIAFEVSPWERRYTGGV